MSRKYPRTRLLVSLALGLTFVGAAAPPAAHAAVLPDLFTGVTTSSLTGYLDGTRMTSNLTWCVPTGAKVADTYSLGMPAQVSTDLPTTFDLKVGDNVVADAVRDGATYTTTLTAYGEANVGTCGKVAVDGTLHSGLQLNGPTDLSLSYDLGQAAAKVTIRVTSDSYVTPAPAPSTTPSVTQTTSASPKTTDSPSVAAPAPSGSASATDSASSTPTASTDPSVSATPTVEPTTAPTTTVTGSGPAVMKAAAVSAASVRADVVTGFSLISKYGFQEGTPFDAVMSYCVPADVQSGDSFTVVMPAEVKFGANYGLQLFPDADRWGTGSAITDWAHPAGPGTFTYSSPITYTLTFNDNAASHGGNCYSTSTAGQSNPVAGITGIIPTGLVQNNQPTDVTLNFSSGGTLFPVSFTVNPVATDPAGSSMVVKDEFGNYAPTPETAASIGTKTSEWVYAYFKNNSPTPMTNVRMTSISLTDGVEETMQYCYNVDQSHGYMFDSYDIVQPGQEIYCMESLGNITPGTMSHVSVLFTTTDTFDSQTGGYGNSYSWMGQYYVTNVAQTPGLNDINLGGYAFVDTNANGVMDPGEPVLANETVTIYRTDWRDVLDGYGQPISSTTTDANGKYNFDVLVLPYAGLVYEVNMYTPSGYETTVGNYGYLRSAIDFTVAGGTDQALNFGFIVPVPIVGAITITEGDANGNAGDTPQTAVDLGYEPGSTGLVFTITNTGNATLWWVDISDVVMQGSGKVSNLVCTYPTPVITITSLGLKVSAQAAGDTISAGDPWNDGFQPGQVITCTADLTNVTADVMHLDEATVTANWYADGSEFPSTLTATNPYFATAKAAVSVGRAVFIDENRNGVQEPTEKGLPGITLKVTGPDNAPVIDLTGKPVEPVTTDANGLYAFTNLPALQVGQHYRVTVVTETGLLPSPGNTGTAESTDLTKNGASDMSLDFGYYPPAVVVEAPVDPPVQLVTIPTGDPSLNGSGVVSLALGLLLLLGGVTVTIARRRRA